MFSFSAHLFPFKSCFFNFLSFFLLSVRNSLPDLKSFEQARFSESEKSISFIKCSFRKFLKFSTPSFVNPKGLFLSESELTIDGGFNKDAVCASLSAKPKDPQQQIATFFTEDSLISLA